MIECEVVEHPDTTNPWTIIRRIALQVLYEVDSAGHPVGEVLDRHLANYDLKPKIAKYLRKLVSTVIEHRQQLDVVIQRSAPEWPLGQVAVVDRNILRIAVTEFAILTHTPLKVAIDEAVQLAKLFGADGAPRFVNGVLGTLASDPDVLRQALTKDVAGGNERTENPESRF